MNVKLKTYGLLTIAMVLFSTNIIAQTKLNPTQSALVELKCYVELYGGKETIHFAMVNKNDVADFAERLVGQKIATSLSKQKQEIYRVKECTKLRGKFSTGRGRKIDQQTVR